jgi:pimeloyl-ACP methyl ester carboxylesterase
MVRSRCSPRRGWCSRIRPIACRATVEQGSPEAVAQAVKDADTFFGVELPALAGWAFGAEQAARVRQPTLSVLGGRTEQLWVEVDEFLQASLPHVQSCTVPGVGHLLHGQRAEPVAAAMARFFARHPLPQR